MYRTPVKRRYGHQNPVNFQDIQNLISRYNLCDDLEKARELESLHIVFNCNEPYIKKQIFLDRESLIMDQFEFSHTETGKYIRGERTREGIRIYSNFMISEFEVLAQGGQLAYNKKIQVKMQVNPKRYSIINL